MFSKRRWYSEYGHLEREREKEREREREREKKKIERECQLSFNDITMQYKPIKTKHTTIIMCIHTHTLTQTSTYRKISTWGSCSSCIGSFVLSNSCIGKTPAPWGFLNGADVLWPSSSLPSQKTEKTFKEGRPLCSHTNSDDLTS